MNTPNTPDTQTDLSRVLEKITEIATASANGAYIYRGESEIHDKVSSNLYREYEKDVETEHFDIKVVQEEILREAKEYTDKADEFEILTELQHHGGKTNLIDFTTDYLVALFFACDGNRDEPGTVILLQNQSEAYEVVKPPRTIARAGVQKSIFVQAPSGIVEPDTVVCIPADLKGAMLDYLRKHHDISTKTIYNDLLGFIEKRESHKSAYTEFYTGFTCQERENSAKNPVEKQKWNDKAVAHYTEAIDLNPDFAAAYNNRGTAYSKKDEFDTAIQDYDKAINLNPEHAEPYYNRGTAYYHKDEFDRAIQDYDKAINLNPEHAEAYANKGGAWLHLREWEKAKADLSTAKDMGNDIVAAFHNNYESVENFEMKHGIEVPEDIAALLRQD